MPQPHKIREGLRSAQATPVPGLGASHGRHRRSASRRKGKLVMNSQVLEAVMGQGSPRFTH